jgi:hypothetical protein
MAAPACSAEPVGVAQPEFLFAQSGLLCVPKPIRPSIPKIPSDPDSRDGAESSHHETRYLRSYDDGGKAGPALIPTVIATRNSDLLYRVLVELRSFDNLLAFRFG